MEKILKGKKFFAFTKGLACFTGILLIMLAVFSCTNMLIRDGGSLIIALPGARAATASRFTIELTGTNGTPKSQTLEGGTTAQFDDLAPDTYSIVVKGMDASSGAVVFYGTDSATVKAGETKSANVELMKGASDFASLEAAVAAGGTVYIFESIDVETTLSVPSGISVTILPAYQDVTLKNIGSGSLFDVNSGELTIGGGEYTITLDGNTLSHHAINIQYTGKATLSTNAVIMNCGTSSVKLYNPNYGSSAIFYLDGGSIRDNKGSGVEAGYYGKFYMNSGIIERNESSSGGGVNLTDSTAALYMEGGSITGNKAKSGQGGGVYVGQGSLHMNGGYITENESSGGGGGIYFGGSIAMTGGYIGGNSSLSNSGNGIFDNGNTAVFKMSGSTVIAPDNDVYLNKNGRITITGELTGDSPVATITLYTDGYTAGTLVLSNGMEDAFGLITEVGKFAVTPESDGKKWTIDTSGNLKEQ